MPKMLLTPSCVFVIAGRGSSHSHVPGWSHALRLVDRAASGVPGLRQGNPGADRLLQQ